MDTTWVPESCTLPASEQAARVHEFDDLFTRSVRGATRVDARLLRLDLAPSGDVAAEAARLAARETSCCGFFTFTLVASGAGLRMDVAVPPERTAVLDALAARVG